MNDDELDWPALAVVAVVSVLLGVVVGWIGAAHMEDYRALKAQVEQQERP